jgi:murein DD-endopeptidase MepM/ murein hydrolase activator NlpD
MTTISSHWCNPVGDVNVREFPPGNWRISNPFLAWYKLGEGFTYHTGVDINLPGTQDVNQPVRAITEGVVVFAQYLSSSTWLGLVVIKHQWGELVLFSRYGHMRGISVQKGDRVAAGDVIGQISPTAGTVAKFEPHLHFDLSALDDRTLEANPTNWPGTNKAFIEAHYQDPRAFMAARLAGDDGGEIPSVGLITREYKVITTVALSLREWPDVDSRKLTSIQPGSMVTASNQIKVGEDGYTWTFVLFNGFRGWVATGDKTTGNAWLEGFQ